MDKPINIALCDDHTLVRETLGQFIKSNLDSKITLSACSAEELLQKLPNRFVDIIVLEIGLPGMDGLKCLIELKKLYPDIKVVVLTMYDDETLLLKLLRNKVDGYVNKGEKSVEILQALKAVSEDGFILVRMLH